MLNNMDIEPRPKRTRGFAPHLPSALHDLLNSEIEAILILAVEQCSRYPNLIRYFHTLSRCDSRLNELRCPYT